MTAPDIELHRAYATGRGDSRHRSMIIVTTSQSHFHLDGPGTLYVIEVRPLNDQEVVERFLTAAGWVEGFPHRSDAFGVSLEDMPGIEISAATVEALRSTQDRDRATITRLKAEVDQWKAMADSALRAAELSGALAERLGRLLDLEGTARLTEVFTKAATETRS